MSNESMTVPAKPRDAIGDFYEKALRLAKEQCANIIIAEETALVTTYLADAEVLKLLKLVASENNDTLHLVALAFNGNDELVRKAIIDEALRHADNSPTKPREQLDYACNVLDETDRT